VTSSCREAAASDHAEAATAGRSADGDASSYGKPLKKSGYSRAGRTTYSQNVRLLLAAAIALIVPSAAVADNWVDLKLVLDGNGSRVIPFSNGRGGPLLIIMSGGREGNFIVSVVAPSGRRTLLVNTIGEYTGATLVPYASAGRFRLAVQATGVWNGSVSRLLHDPKAKPLLRRFSYNGGDLVEQVRAGARVTPTVRARCSCEGNFIVHLRDYRGRAQLLFNEIGSYRGQTVARPIARGQYILQVQGDGPWSLTFSR
jgi:hypothetical protein